MNRIQVKHAQQILKDAGFYKGEIDGLWGSNTEKAKEEWEKSTGRRLLSEASKFTSVDSIGGRDLVRYNDSTLFTRAGATINADGSPHAYHKDSNKALDYLSCAGHSGNWWGIVTKNGKPIIQGPDDPAPGFYVSCTSLKVKGAPSIVRKQMDAETVPFIVLPGGAPFAKLGDYCTVWYPKTESFVHGIFADVGPRTHWGEISYKMAQMLKLANTSPKNGGVSSGIYYFIYPNTGKAEWNDYKGEREIDSLYLTEESMTEFAGPLFEAINRDEILKYYGV
jgi:hypothetical protein